MVIRLFHKCGKGERGCLRHDAPTLLVPFPAAQLPFGTIDQPLLMKLAIKPQPTAYLGASLRPLTKQLGAEWGLQMELELHRIDPVRAIKQERGALTVWECNVLAAGSAVCRAPCRTEWRGFPDRVGRRVQETPSAVMHKSFGSSLVDGGITLRAGEAQNSR